VSERFPPLFRARGNPRPLLDLQDGGKIAMNVGHKLAEAVYHGAFYCEVCETDVDMSDVSGYDEARRRALTHAEENH
jgi:hypothetical protein